MNERFDLALEDIEFGRVFDQSHFKATMRHPPVIGPALRRQCEELWGELMERARAAETANEGATAKSYRPFVLKTDHTEYERLRLEIGLGGVRRDKGSPVRPAISNALGDGEVSGGSSPSACGPGVTASSCGSWSRFSRVFSIGSPSDESNWPDVSARH